jgi:cardiolipin synthase
MKAVFHAGNRLQLLQSGTEFFPSLLKAIEGAREEIYLETYIFEPDATGQRVAYALAQAAARGVAVRLLVDGFGSLRFVRQMLPGLLNQGVAVLVYRRELSPFLARKRRLRRLHRKLCVIDAAIAFVGGINIIDDFNPPGSHTPRLDYTVAVEGPLLQPIHASVRRMWERVAFASFKRRLAKDVPRAPATAACGPVRAAFLVRDNLGHRRDIEQAYLHAIAAAQNEVLIANAYFLPGRSFRLALEHAARRGVAVTLVLQGRIEYRLLHYATQALYGGLMAAGVAIIEYDHSYLHAKVAVVDVHWATVGSSNIDPFSLLVAREANVVVDDAAFASHLRQRLLQQIQTGGRALDPAKWAERGWMSRLLHRLAYTLLRFFIGLAGHRGEH